MNKRAKAVTAILLCVALAGLALAVGACGGTLAGSSTTTAASSATTAAEPTTATTAPATATSTVTTAAGSVTLPSLQMTPELQQYAADMQGWAAALGSLPAGDPLEITDATTVTAEELKAAQDFAAKVRAALDQLKAVRVPASLDAFHQALVTMIAGGVDATDKAVQALEKKDQAMLDAAKEQADQLESQLDGLMESLMPLLMGGTATS